ncbi:hypothetical protein CRUP_007716 [Coryphaenoides rupestris]|nr:hypothetical protein CRUP_007716 [Coryphaenoides rupestris]
MRPGESVSAGSAHLRDLRLVVYGRKWSGRTYTANALLGREHFLLRAFTENREGVGVVAGRWRVHVVLSPGWWKPFLPNETMELSKLEMIRGAAPGGPGAEGPHALLLVIDIDTPLDEKSAQAAEKHLELLGGSSSEGAEAVWRHTIVVLNEGIRWEERGADPSAQEHLRSRFLARIVRRCGGRYHLLNTAVSHPGQVLRLLEKVEGLVEVNGGGAFRLDAALATATERRLREVREAAAARRANDATKTDLLREMYKDHQLSEVRLLLLGWSLSGKTTVADTILGGPDPDAGWKGSTRASEERRGRVGRWAVQVVDTPGWWRFGSSEDTPEAVRQEIVKGVWLAGPPGPQAVVLVVCACIAFTAAHLRAIREHMAFLGADVWRHTVVLFNWCEANGDTRLEQFIEAEGRPLRWLLRRCGNRYHAFNMSAVPDMRGQVAGLLERVEWMAAGNSVLQVHPVDPWEEEEEEGEEWEGVVIETLPRGVPLMELFSQVCRKREQEFLESIRRVLETPRRASSIAGPPDLSEEEMESNERRVREWLNGSNEDEDEEDPMAVMDCHEGQSPISPTMRRLRIRKQQQQQRQSPG